ncbi:POP1-domain-containing protein [Rickenella mellea]|uniref:POP1-domain-containing protein n=1 Tax=Rickenella mellea TaxID=50990 RepID=A0A4Y7Q3L3_9AGAM|nr:POP1-domain-containing protein [Rickenella mellea]
MPPKRKMDGDNDRLTSHQKKKQRTDAARTIAVQPSPLAGPSKPAANGTLLGLFSCSNTLPATIDVERFAEARAFEINAMQEAMENSRASATHRVWQTLPRHLRRRAASHDVRRVPARLRERARAEMDPVRKKALGRSMPKRGKARRVSRTENLLKRQRDKAWLETHIWHAKRMKMENMWGYRLAVHTTEKSFRPSHRASLHGSILHDASYDGVIELKGPEKILKEVLSQCSDPQGAGPGAVRFLSGSRVCDIHMYKPLSYPFGLIGPTAVMWQPCDPTPQVPPAATNASQKKKKKKGKSKETATDSTPVAKQPASGRRIWVICHPLIYQDVYSALQSACSNALDAIRAAGGDVVEIELADLRQQMNVFEIMGPKASQVIKGALTPVKEEENSKEFKQFWSTLAHLQSSGSVPRGMVIGFTVQDPRLDFPPKNAKAHIDSETLPSISSPAGLWPTPQLASSTIWDDKVRDGLSQPRFKKKDIDERRAKNLIPGAKLSPLRQDDRIPILLIQRSLEPLDTSNIEPKTAGNRATHGWTMIFPKGWGMHFLSSLVFTGTRVGGQRERESQRFESGCLYFPNDYPTSAGYAQFAEEREEVGKSRWERKPPAKRPNWKRLGTRSPWKPDWEVVLGLKKASNTPSDDLVPTQREPGDDEMDRDITPWLLRGIEAKSILTSACKLPIPAIGLAASVNALRAKRQFPPLAIPPEDIWCSALVMVTVSFPYRGAPEDLANIYLMLDEEARIWTDFLRKPTDEVPPELPEGTPSADAIVGYITSGDYSLSLGRGQAIGAIPINRWSDLQSQTRRLGKSLKPVVKVRDRAGVICRPAYLEILG